MNDNWKDDSRHVFIYMKSVVDPVSLMSVSRSYSLTVVEIIFNSSVFLYVNAIWFTSKVPIITRILEV